MTKVCEYCQIGTLDSSSQCGYCGSYEPKAIHGRDTTDPSLCLECGHHVNTHSVSVGHCFYSANDGQTYCTCTEFKREPVSQ